ncbi:hypothetical protein T069G_04280 [Trichoderma breve]|uniref:Uncharacterized protein n=1 Tax=Trichoderma breve TaxID=2034170 RepID=A0A9W9JPU5_9HYPO|nr:hypothetical protein T069G_04280 [Trichoderma breve]KAJ4863326.1 hypothetical protein T069G_04280 [Trichoderma breve]
MATVLVRQFLLKVQLPRPVITISKQLYSSLYYQPARFSHPPSTILAACQPTRINLFNRPFMASASSHEKSTSIAMNWDDLSDERKIQLILNSGSSEEKWGWVIYRCSYKPELQSTWENFKRVVDERTRKEIAESDAPDIADKLDWVFVEDPELEGASLDELKRRFREWARFEVQGRYDIDTTSYNRGSRYGYFIQVDEAALLSLVDGLSYGHVNIVRGWVDSLPPEEATDEFGDAIDIEDWMKIRASMVAPYFYIDLDGEEDWYAHYTPPPHGLCIW